MKNNRYLGILIVALGGMFSVNDTAAVPISMCNDSQQLRKHLEKTLGPIFIDEQEMLSLPHEEGMQYLFKHRPNDWRSNSSHYSNMTYSERFKESFFAIARRNPCHISISSPSQYYFVIRARKAFRASSDARRRRPSVWSGSTKYFPLLVAHLYMPNVFSWQS